MLSDQLIKLTAAEHGLDRLTEEYELIDFARAVESAARREALEEAAKVCEDVPSPGSGYDHYNDGYDKASYDCAAEIRALIDQPAPSDPRTIEVVDLSDADKHWIRELFLALADKPLTPGPLVPGEPRAIEVDDLAAYVGFTDADMADARQWAKDCDNKPQFFAQVTNMVSDTALIEYLITTNPWPKQVYDAMVLKRANQREVIAAAMQAKQESGK